MDPNNSRAIRGILVEVINHPSIETGEVMTINAPDWRSEIIEYLKSPTRETESESAKLRIRAARYILIDDVLYKKSFSLPYLRCLRPDEAQYALRDPRRHLWPVYRGSIPLLQDIKTRVLLANNKERLCRFCPTVQQVPKIRQNNAPTSRATFQFHSPFIALFQLRGNMK